MSRLNAYVSEPQWGEIGRDIRAARDTLERQEKQQSLNIDEIKAQLKAQQSAQDQALCILRHNLASSTYNPQSLYVPRASEINEATIARKIWNGYLRHSDTRRMDPTETKSLSLAKPEEAPEAGGDHAR